MRIRIHSPAFTLNLFNLSCSLSNVHIGASFGPDGLLQSITTLADNQRTACQLQFMRYGTRPSGDKSGAYLFLPEGAGRVSSVSRSAVRVVEGRLRSYAETRLGWNVHRVTLYNSPGVDGTALQVSMLFFYENLVTQPSRRGAGWEYL